jgi:TetR/AcrR family transcriptional repressor of nem operon
MKKEAALLRQPHLCYVWSGEFKKGISARELAYTFFCAIEGAIMFSRVEGSCAPMDIIINHCKKKLDQISNAT